MRVMVIVKANEETEAGTLPKQEMFEAMGRFNEELVKAGVLLAADGLKASSNGVRVHFDGERRSVQDGPFAETKELIAGFWIWQVKSLEEAIEWAKRCPNPTGEAGVLEIRPVFEPEDLGPEFTAELQEQERRIAEQAALNARA